MSISHQGGFLVNDYLNSGNIALLVMIVYSIMRFLAPRTESKVDDRLVAGIETGLAWLRENMPDAFSKVEAAARGGGMTTGAAKLAAYLWELNEAHIADHGVPMPAEMIEQAKRKAAGAAAADKAFRAIPAAAAAEMPGPPEGPASA
jgi:hypothetical protein